MNENACQKIKYTDDALIIRIPTTNPSGLHEHLMRSISAAFKSHLASPDDVTKEDCENLQTLIKLLDVIIPCERQLELAYS